MVSLSNSMHHWSAVWQDCHVMADKICEIPFCSQHQYSKHVPIFSARALFLMSGLSARIVQAGWCGLLSVTEMLKIRMRSQE